jgi:hypothetical protein
MGSSTYFGESHLDFIELPLEKGKKMPTYEVMNTKFDEPIGIIHWRGGWLLIGLSMMIMLVCWIQMLRD